MKKKQLLERVTVPFRCPMSWDGMVGDDRERFCGQCQKSVTDLSELTLPEVSAYVAEHGPRGSACVRIWRDANGNLMTKGCGSVAAKGQRLAQKSVAVGMATSSLAAAACSSQGQAMGVAGKGAPPFPSPVVPEECTEEFTVGTVMMGMICLPPETD